MNEGSEPGTGQQPPDWRVDAGPPSTPESAGGSVVPPSPDAGWQMPPPPPPATVRPKDWKRGRPVPLRAMGVGEVIDAGINLYRLYWKALMGIAAAVTVPVVFLQEFLTKDYTQRTSIFNFQSEPVYVSQSELNRLIVITLVFAAVQLLLLRPFLTAAMLRAVAGAYLGEVPTVGASYDFALSRFGSVLWVTFLVGVAMFGYFFVVAFAGGILVATVLPIGVILIIAGAVFAAIMYIRFLFSPAVVVVEQWRGTQAMRRSWHLALGRFWPIVGAGIIASIISAVVSGIMTLLPAYVATRVGTGGWVLRALGSSLASVVTTPFATIVTVLLYFDLRIRKEGLDLAIMAQEVGSARR